MVDMRTREHRINELTVDLRDCLSSANEKLKELAELGVDISVDTRSAPIEVKGRTVDRAYLSAVLRVRI